MQMLGKTQTDLCASGVRIPFDPLVITPPVEHAIRAGFFEAEEAAQIPAIVEPEDVVLEIGAGIGFISTLLAREPKVQRVIAVEANPDLMPYMARLHALNRVDKVERLNVVLGNGLGPYMTFYQRRDFWMGSLAKGPEPYEQQVEVPTRDLNALLRDNGVNLIVCDIEGAESVVFAGADLTPVDRIYLELHDHITGLKGIADVFRHMSEGGFTYDPRHSSGAIVLFRKVMADETLRPYARL